MAIFKPEVKSSPTNFLGLCKFGILEFRDRSSEFDWADIFIEVLVKQEGSEYDRTIQIKGSLDKENGKIVGGAVLKRMYHTFEQLGCDAGINIDGGWEDSDGTEIKDIAKYLNDKFVIANGKSEPDMHYLGYFYREKPKVPGAKAYTRAFAKFYKNENDSANKLQNDVDWMKSKGYLKEMTDEVESKTEMSGSGLDNL
tara:strand:- start:434 stop:1027 length:594 start_codon:yes stop_codon:yes gene_type:complete